MKKLGSRPPRIGGKYLVAAFIVAMVGLAISFMTYRPETNTFSDLQYGAALRTKEALSALKADIIDRGIPIADDDLNATFLIGPEFTELTTTVGIVDAKRTSLNPNFSAAIIRYFHDAGLQEGDTVAIGTSGSFPGFLIASTIAASEMGLKAKVIASCGSSMYGATRPEYNIFDILIFLQENGFADLEILAVSGGGENDQGGGVLEGILYQDTKELSLSLCRAAAERTGAEILNYDRLEESIKRRLELYGTDVDLFINIGGAAPNSGSSSYTLNFPQGLVLNPPYIPTSAVRGLCYEFASRGVPVLNLLNVKQLASDNGILYDSVPMEEPGSGLVYQTFAYNRALMVLTLIATVAVLGYGRDRHDEGVKRCVRGTMAVKLLILISALLVMWAAAVEFVRVRRTHDSFVASECLAEVKSLSLYEPTLAGTAGDVPVYVFDSNVEGGTLLVVGGTHPSESAGILSAYLLMENLEIDKGRVIVIPIANGSGATTGVNGFAYPPFYSIETDWGGKSYRVGSRVAHPLDQWPDPPLFIQYPSHTRLCYEDARNLNRNYPGRSSGSLVERVGSAIMNLIEVEAVNFAFDLHEASITYPANHTFIVPEKSSDIAFLSALTLEEEGIEMQVEIATGALSGFSHQEWGNSEHTFPFLIEVPTPFIDRIVGPMTESLITEGKDEFLVRMSDRGFTGIDYQREGVSLAQRCGLHLSSMARVVSIGSLMYPQYEVIARWPELPDLLEHGIGSYLHDPEEGAAMGRVQLVTTGKR